MQAYYRLRGQMTRIPKKSKRIHARGAIPGARLAKSICKILARMTGDTCEVEALGFYLGRHAFTITRREPGGKEGLG